MDGLGWGYLWMVLAAMAAIAIDQALLQGSTSSARVALDGAVGAAIGLGVLKLVVSARRSP